MSLNQQHSFSQAKLLAYKIPFHKPMQFKGSQLHYREGLILQLNDINDGKHFAEIAPLPGFSQETYSEVKAEIIKILSTEMNHFNKNNSDFKSLQFALDSLSLNDVEDTFKHLVNIDNIPLFQGDSVSLKEQYDSLNNPNLIKLKVARGAVEVDIANFQLLCKFNPSLKIRCDANQAWDTKQADQFFSTINSEHLDYIEEPTKNHKENLQLAEKHKIYLGLDETLQDSGFSYQHHHCIKAFVIKPTLIGSKQKVDNFVSIAKKHSIQVSFSSSFETTVGLQILKKLANHYLAKPSHHNLKISLGVDTLKYFDSTLLVDEKKIEQDCQKLEVLWVSN